MALLIIPVLKRWSRARGPYGYLRTWNWPITAREISQPYHKYLLFAECEVRTASYGLNFFPSFYGQARSARAMKTRKEKTRIHNLPYGPSKRGQYDVYYIALLIIAVLKRWSRARGPYGYLRTWNWPITAREISQPYNKYLLLAECEVRMASYGLHFFPSFYGQARSARAMKTRKEKTRIHNLPYGPSKRGQYDVYYIALLIISVLKRWSRARGPYGYLRTWNWPITAREISQPYHK